mmetsp:Transcript_85132/g.197952  ORF Transcript_85132/g.197952 Transcript_85132/m.197952 type:complete len:385 (+) Transcript_85132:102-1256(+)
MGQQLSGPVPKVLEELILPWTTPVAPVTEKDSGDGRCTMSDLLWGFSSMQGWRESMEDAHIVNPPMSSRCFEAYERAARPEVNTGWGETPMPIFAVMDGHGGEQVARFCELHLPGEIARFPCWDIANALRAAYHRMDELLADPRNLHLLQSLSKRAATLRTVDPRMTGCTAVVCCVRPDSIVVANAGDSRAVLCRDGRAIDMSEDHKPNLPSEVARIQKAGGCVLNQHYGPHVLHRVNGDLSLSRSIGDLRYKQNTQLTPDQQIICSTPDVRIFQRRPTDEFMVLACDGVWDVLTSQQVVDFIRPRLHQLLNGGMRTSLVVEDLLDTCLSPDPRRTYGIGGDNMTMVLVAFTGLPQEVPQDPILPSLLQVCQPRKAAATCPVCV